MQKLTVLVAFATVLLVGLITSLVASASNLGQMQGAPQGDPCIVHVEIDPQEKGGSIDAQALCQGVVQGAITLTTSSAEMVTITFKALGGSLEVIQDLPLVVGPGGSITLTASFDSQPASWGWQRFTVPPRRQDMAGQIEVNLAFGQGRNATCPARGLGDPVYWAQDLNSGTVYSMTVPLTKWEFDLPVDWRIHGPAKFWATGADGTLLAQMWVGSAWCGTDVPPTATVTGTLPATPTIITPSPTPTATVVITIPPPVTVTPPPPPKLAECLGVDGMPASLPAEGKLVRLTISASPEAAAIIVRDLVGNIVAGPVAMPRVDAYLHAQVGYQILVSTSQDGPWYTSGLCTLAGVTGLKDGQPEPQAPSSLKLYFAIIEN